MIAPENYYEPSKQPLNIFTEYETMELLKLIEDVEIQKLFATYRKKHKYVWTLISNILAEKGINKSEDKCANRFENMKAKFFKIEKRRMQGYNEDTDWPYYDFFARFMNSNYMSSDMQQQHLPQTVLPHLPPHQSYNIPKVKLEPSNAMSLLESSYHENGELTRVINPMHHSYGFNTNGIPDIIQPTNQDLKPNLQLQDQHQNPQREQEEPQNRHEEIQENQENTNEEKQQILISPQYVHHVERTDSENQIENSNESASNPPVLDSNINNVNSNINKNLNESYQNIHPTTNQQPFRRTPSRIPSNYNASTPSVMGSNFNAKFARKFKKIKIDEELMAVRKEKYALELEILRFQLDNEKKINEKHLLDLKILEEKLKNERYQNQLLERTIQLNENGIMKD